MLFSALNDTTITLKYRIFAKKYDLTAGSIKFQLVDIWKKYLLCIQLKKYNKILSSKLSDM